MVGSLQAVTEVDEERRLTAYSMTHRREGGSLVIFQGYFLLWVDLSLVNGTSFFLLSTISLLLVSLIVAFSTHKLGRNDVG